MDDQFLKTLLPSHQMKFLQEVMEMVGIPQRYRMYIRVATHLTVCLALLLLTCAGQSVWADNPVSDGPANPTELVVFFDDMMPKHLDSFRIPGATVAVVKDGAIVLTKGYGYANLESRALLDADRSLMRIASVTKLFTWTGVMQLVEQGKLDLDADVNTYLTAFQIPATYPQPITLAHLMAHTAGFEDRGIGSAVRAPQGLPELGLYLAQHVPARVRPPGQVAAYSNYGGALAGYIVAQVAGMPYEQYVARYILDPLGMAHSSVQQPLPPHLASDAALSYAYIQGTYRPTSFMLDPLSPAGAMSASATDMARFMLAHLQNGRYGDTRILQEATARQMHAQSFTHHPRLVGWAHGFQEMRINGQRALFHDGSWQSFISLLLLVPEQNLGLFVSYNSPGGGRAINDLLPAFFDRYYPATPPAAPQPPAGFAQRAGRFVGSYQPTRRPYTTIEKLTRNIPLARLSAAPDGSLRFLGQRWVEVEPLVFQADDSEDVLAFFADGRGHITGAASGAFAMDKLRWYDLPDFHWALLAICLVLLLTGVLGWPLAACVHRRRGTSRPDAPRLARRARWVAGLAGLLALLFLGALAVTLRQMSLLYGLPLGLRALLAVPLLLALLTLITAICGVLAWRQRYWSIWGRIHYSLVTLALVGLMWVMSCYNLIGLA
jgi:CubicO group peptidase (beta-lactamase class C family)